MNHEVLRYRVGTLGIDVHIYGTHRCVEINEKGIFPLKRESHVRVVSKLGRRTGRFTIPEVKIV